MPFSFELDPDKPILENRLGAQFGADEFPRMAEEANAWLNRAEQRVYYIVNLGDLRLNLGDIMQGAYYAAQGATPPLHHRNIIEAMVVTTDPMIAMAAKSVNTYIFGNLRLKVFETLDEALRYVDGQVAASSG